MSIPTSISILTCTHIVIPIYVHIYVGRYIYIYPYNHIYIYVFTLTYIYIYTYIYIPISIPIYISHTYISMSIPLPILICIHPSTSIIYLLKETERKIKDLSHGIVQCLASLNITGQADRLEIQRRVHVAVLSPDSTGLENDRVSMLQSSGKDLFFGKIGFCS